MTTYERIRFDGRTIILRDVVETTVFGITCISGVHVDAEGNEIAPADADERRHIIEAGLVTRRTPMRMNVHYATLEVDHDAIRARDAAAGESLDRAT